MSMSLYEQEVASQWEQALSSGGYGAGLVMLVRVMPEVEDPVGECVRRT